MRLSGPVWRVGGSVVGEGRGRDGDVRRVRREERERQGWLQQKRREGMYLGKEVELGEVLVVDCIDQVGAEPQVIDLRIEGEGVRGVREGEHCEPVHAGSHKGHSGLCLDLEINFEEVDDDE